ncbi:hypothetical protein [Ralstonia mannitolilytica]|uniref:hypothetical protein n=1 Tax=Ralstonia mannitolilytica TaxID=105219 RepID=UPI0028F67C73|nr:hypothetical protein [Ralstonia mannitolilytica]CAJ0733979.1 hypothetical protein R76696_00557 [Ralstonia mannitolilytica]
MTWRSGVRYEVALDAIGALLSHLAEQMASERDVPTPDVYRLHVLMAVRACVLEERDMLEPERDPQGVESAVARFGAMARAAFGQSEPAFELRAERLRQFEHLEAAVGRDEVLPSGAAEVLRQMLVEGVIDVDVAGAAYRRMRAEVLRLSKHDQEVLARALLDPPPKASALERAERRNSQLFGDGGSR